MTLLDVWAAAAAFIAGSNILFRAHMLRPRLLTWTSAPTVVWLALSMVAMALWMTAISIVFGGHANSREGMIYSLEALGSFVMLWNLAVNGRQADARRRQIAEDVALAMKLSGAPAPYGGEQQ